jgi:glycosyltransferase involved in cell wall biosynthesis
LTIKSPFAMTDLVVVIPVFNEENNVVPLYERLRGVVTTLGKSYRFVFVNDGSRDNTLQKLRELASRDKQVKYIDLSRNFGHQIAVTAGLHFAKGKRVVIIDADLQDPPELIGEMDRKMDDGWNVVYARRRQRKGESFFKLATAQLFYRLLKNITSVDIPVDTGDFRMMDWKVVEVINRMPEHHKFIRGMVSWVGFRQTWVEYDRDQRHSGKTGYTFSKMLRFAFDGITGFSNIPLKVATWLGFGISFVSFILILYTLYARFVTRDYVEGWASIMISILFIGGIQLICLGLIGEYIIRMNDNVRQRPLYIINDTNVEE